MNALFARLRFIALHLLLLAGCGSIIKAQSEASSSGDFSFAFITDIHLDYNKSFINDFERALKKINNLSPDFILTGGDNIRDAARPSESRSDSLFSLYKLKISEFKMPVYTGIGNHELFGINNPAITPLNPLYGKKMYELKVGKPYYSFVHKGWKFFMIDDIKISESGNKYIGYVDENQLKWIRSELEITSISTPIVICCHIPFISSMKKFELGSLAANPVNDGVENSVEFFKLFARHNLKLVLQGHFHFMEVLYTNGVYYITSPSVNGSYGSALTKKAGFFMFNTSRDSISWRFIGNN